MKFSIENLPDLLSRGGMIFGAMLVVTLLGAQFFRASTPAPQAPESPSPSPQFQGASVAPTVSPSPTVAPSAVPQVAVVPSQLHLRKAIVTKPTDGSNGWYVRARPQNGVGGWILRDQSGQNITIKSGATIEVFDEPPLGEWQRIPLGANGAGWVHRNALNMQSERL